MLREANYMPDGCEKSIPRQLPDNRIKPWGVRKVTPAEQQALMSDFFTKCKKGPVLENLPVEFFS